MVGHKAVLIPQRCVVDRNSITFFPHRGDLTTRQFLTEGMVPMDRTVLRSIVVAQNSPHLNSFGGDGADEDSESMRGSMFLPHRFDHDVTEIKDPPTVQSGAPRC